MTRREDYLKLIYTLSKKGDVISPETYIALNQLWQERQVRL